MNANIQKSSEHDIRVMEASDWLLRLQDPDVDEQTTARWLEWCQADERNLAAFEHIRELWHTFDDERLGTSLCLSLAERKPSSGLPDSPGEKRGGTSIFLGLAASLLLAAGGFWYLTRPANPLRYTQTFNTAVASLSRQTLSDGSTLELGARSTVRVELTKEHRNVRLDDGEAFFEVAKDPDRPFVVQAGDLNVIAIGTAFNVRKAQDRVVVTVREGIVRIEPNDTSPALSGSAAVGAVRAAAGHQVTYSTQQHSLTMKNVEAADAARTRGMTWQVGRLEFANEPLGSVIAEINRYTRRPIVIADDQLSELKFTGTVRSDAIDDWLRGLENVFPIEVMNRDEQGVLLVHRPD